MASPLLVLCISYGFLFVEIRGCLSFIFYGFFFNQDKAEGKLEILENTVYIEVTVFDIDRC